MPAPTNFPRDTLADRISASLQSIPPLKVHGLTEAERAIEAEIDAIRRRNGLPPYEATTGA